MGLVLASGLRAAELQVMRVDKISTITQHNAFTDLVRFNEQFYCTWREAASHTSADGELRVVRSADGTNWTSVALMIPAAGVDFRDSKLEVTPDNRLMLHSCEKYPSGSPLRRNIAWFTTDGTNWVDETYIAEDDIWFWKHAWHEGVGYGVGYDGIAPYTFNRLYTSTDPTNWTIHVTNLVVSTGGPSETALVFMPDDTAYGLVRRDFNNVNSALLITADPPYTDWSVQNLGVRVGGPEMIRLPDNRLLAAVRLYSPNKTWLCWVDPGNGSLTPALQLPSGGDTSYAGMVWHDDHLWVSYYSSDNINTSNPLNDPTSVYIAEVAYTPAATTGRIIRHEGTNDPVNVEGWTLFSGGGGGVVVGPVASDPPDGLDAWKVDDNSTALNTRIAYRFTPSSVIQANAAAEGWTLRMRLRVADLNDAIDFSVHGSCAFAYPGFVKNFGMAFGRDIGGNLRVGLWDGAVSGSTVIFTRTATVEGSGYHLCELVYDPVAKSAALFVDGSEVLSDYPGIAYSGDPRVLWGSNQSASTGQGNYNLVEFIVGPYDTDGDGLTDAEERVAGTDWLDPFSVLQINAVSNLAGRTLFFPGVSGRTYRAHWSTNLLGPNWWVLTGTSVTVTADGEVEITDTNPPTRQRFYRLTVE